MKNLFYSYKDVMDILKVKRTTAYSVIKALNTELEMKNYMVRKGMVPVKYFNERYGISER